MVNRPEPTRAPRRKQPQAPGEDGAIQLEMLDYIYTEEKMQQAQNLLNDPNFWLELAAEVSDGSPE
ncbi:hypothetical protein AB3R30_21735 [Leptolyngbyaceae cyanobacterium UHCC 1019]